MHLIQATKIVKRKWYGVPMLADIIRHEIIKCSYDYHVRRLAEILTQDTGFYWRMKLDRIRDFLKMRYTFNKHPLGVEMLVKPDLLAKQLLNSENISADCGSITALILALTRSIGFQGHMVFVSPKKDEPYTHVLPAMEYEGGIYQMDLTSEFTRYQEPIMVVTI